MKPTRAALIYTNHPIQWKEAMVDCQRFLVLLFKTQN
jgi:hypothetical protein